jgi:hypothetical protein
MEVSGAGLRLLGGCTGDQVLSWTGTVWQCTSLSGIGAITGTGSIGQVSFFTGSDTIGGSNNLFWDASEVKLGIGTASPAYTLDVAGNVRIVNNLTVGANVVFSSLTPGHFVKTTTGGQLTTQQYVDLIADVTNVLPVASGGTGAITFTQRGVLYGNTESPIQATAAPTPGQLLIGSATSTPTFATMSGDATLSSAGALTLASTGVSAGTYGSGTTIPVITVDVKGRITSISTQAGAFESPLTFSNGLTRTANNVTFGGILTEDTRLYDASNEYIYFDTSSGMIGIGTTAPSLHFRR